MYILLLLPIICGSFGRSADCWVLLQVPLQSDVRSQEQVPVEEEYPQAGRKPSSGGAGIVAISGPGGHGPHGRRMANSFVQAALTS